ncbi:MAG: hypothetical protein AMS24_01795 [Chlamydiae bacterium SM23_39]|nr:MAG: hypothetical protein AMS24_01795 [Chlamydiae bacterium SM23_39]
MKIKLKIIVKGDVQGVFFRAHAKKYAENLSITGYAKNLINGDVEIIALGEKVKLEEFLEKIKKDPGYGRIDKIETFFSEVDKNFEDFKIF